MSLYRTRSSVRFRCGYSKILINICIGDELSDVVRKKYGYIDYDYGINSASTDFVSVISVPRNLYTDIRQGEYFALYVLVVLADTSKLTIELVMPGLHPSFCSYSSLLHW